MRILPFYFHEFCHWFFMWITFTRTVDIDHIFDHKHKILHVTFKSATHNPIKVMLIMGGPLIGMIILLCVSMKFLVVEIIFWKCFFMSKPDRQSFIRYFKIFYNNLQLNND